MKNNKKKGFTLVELLVVIAILAILATVSILGYTSFTAKAKASNAEQEMAQIKTLFLADWLDGFVGEPSEMSPITKDGNKNYTIEPDMKVATLKEVFGHGTSGEEKETENWKFASKVSFYGEQPAENTAGEGQPSNATKGTIAYVVYEQGNGYFAVWKIADDTISTYTALPTDVTTLDEITD